MFGSWKAEFPFIFLTILVGVLLARLLNQPLLVLCVVLALCLVRQVFFTQRLLAWLRDGRSSSALRGDGIWEEVFYLIVRLRRRNKRRKKQLVRMLERFRTATAALPDATVVLGADDEIDWFNTAAGELLGLRREDVGQKICNFIRYPQFVQYLHRGDYESSVGIPSPTQEGIQLEIRIVPYGDQLRLLLAQDVTQLRFMERVRRDFIANVSHELRTPLTVLRGYLETLSPSPDDAGTGQQRIFQRMQQQAFRMQSLIDGLLSLTRLESAVGPLPQKVVDMVRLLDAIRDEAHLLAGDGQQLSVEMQANLDLIGAEQELHSAFSNLVVNAVKFTPQDGSVSVRWIADGDGACLIVQDTGPGIAAEHLPRLTERFYRVENQGSGGGFGLGLAIVKHVLARHGAELKINSTPGKGSQFCCCFPASRVLARKTALPDTQFIAAHHAHQQIPG